MLGRLKRKGFIEADRVGKQRDKTVVRALHAVHGWMYEKIVEKDEAASDAAVDVWFAKAELPTARPKRIGAK